MVTTRRTIVGRIDRDVLEFTVGKDLVLDRVIAEADCIGTAAHVVMLSRLPRSVRPLDAAQAGRVVEALVAVLQEARAGRFRISAADQDVHLAVERRLTARLGDLGRRVHTARSRNDQVAVDLRLYGKEQLLGAMDEAAGLAGVLLRFARRHARAPMVGRTHLQPAMPSSVGLWASAHAESLLDDLTVLGAAYAVNDRCPLGSAAGYGVPVPVNRRLTSRLLGFREPVHNVLYAANARGKCEAVILSALSMAMLSLSRLAEDLIFYALPEIGYFGLPPEFGTGSSIMPQKNNPDVLELVRAKAARVLAHAAAAGGVLKALPGGYNRDLQEIKEPFLDGMATTRACLRILARLVGRVEVRGDALRRAFTPAVFATDRALELVLAGVPFRDAYEQVRGRLGELKSMDPVQALNARRHEGGPAGLDFGLLGGRVREAARFVRAERRRYYRRISALLGVGYPELGIRRRRRTA